MNTKHTPGPWTYEVCDSYPHSAKLTRPYVGPHLFTLEDARRIVACVNALEGVTTEELESGAFKSEIARTLQQRDELLAVVEAVAKLNIGTRDPNTGYNVSLQDWARAAIAKCKGGA